VAGVAAVQDDEFIEMSQAHNRQWLAWTTEQIRGLGLVVPDSYCNFVLARFPEEAADGVNAVKDAAAANDYLQDNGIIVRRMAGYGLPDSLRISIGTEEEMRLVIDTLAAFMEPS